ncbi:hypothetical protein HDU81_010261 [Chytriomyces hyalinus]|nr:hypothetical protein HDU81_010261 [Chytriomyces hyalinus]
MSSSQSGTGAGPGGASLATSAAARGTLTVSPQATTKAAPPTATVSSGGGNTVGNGTPNGIGSTGGSAASSDSVSTSSPSFFTVPVILGLACGGVALIAIILVGIICCRNRRRDRRSKGKSDPLQAAFDSAPEPTLWSGNRPPVPPEDHGKVRYNPDASLATGPNVVAASALAQMELRNARQKVTLPLNPNALSNIDDNSSDTSGSAYQSSANLSSRHSQSFASLYQAQYLQYQHQQQQQAWNPNSNQTSFMVSTGSPAIHQETAGTPSSVSSASDTEPLSKRVSLASKRLSTASSSTAGAPAGTRSAPPTMFQSQQQIMHQMFQQQLLLQQQQSQIQSLMQMQQQPQQQQQQQQHLSSNPMPVSQEYVNSWWQNYYLQNPQVAVAQYQAMMASAANGSGVAPGATPQVKPKSSAGAVGAGSATGQSRANADKTKKKKKRNLWSMDINFFTNFLTIDEIHVMSSLPNSPQTLAEVASSNETDIADYSPESTSSIPAGPTLTDTIMGAPKGVFLGSIAGGACAMVILLVVACFCVGHVRRKERVQRESMNPMVASNQGSLQLDMNSTANVKRALPNKCLFLLKLPVCYSFVTNALTILFKIATILQQQAPSRVDKVLEWLAANDAANSSHFSVSTGRRHSNVPPRIRQNQPPGTQNTTKRTLLSATASNLSKQKVVSKPGQKVGETSVTIHDKSPVPQTQSSAGNFNPATSSGGSKMLLVRNELEPAVEMFSATSIPDPLPLVAVAMAKKAEMKSNTTPIESVLYDPVGVTLVQKTEAVQHGTRLPDSSIVKTKMEENQTAATIGTVICREDTEKETAPHAVQPELSLLHEVSQQFKGTVENNGQFNLSARPKRKPSHTNPAKSKSGKLSTTFSSNKTIGAIPSKPAKDRISPTPKLPSFIPPGPAQTPVTAAVVRWSATDTHLAIHQPMNRTEPHLVNTSFGSSNAYVHAPLIDNTLNNGNAVSFATRPVPHDQISNVYGSKVLEPCRKSAKLVFFERGNTLNQVDSASVHTEGKAHSRSSPRTFPWSRRGSDPKMDIINQIEPVAGDVVEESRSSVELTKPEKPLDTLKIHSKKTMGLLDQLKQCVDRPQVSLEKRYSYMLQRDQQSIPPPMPLSSPDIQHTFPPLPNWNTSNPFVSNGYPVAYQAVPMYPKQSMPFPPAQQHQYSHVLADQSYIDAWWRDYYERDPVAAQEAYYKMGGSFTSEVDEMRESGE